jgi:hypothetical protein
LNTDKYITELIDKIGQYKKRIEELESDVDEYDALRQKMGGILSRTAVALNGPEPRLTKWSWHDLPQIALKLKLQLKRAEKNLLIEKIYRNGADKLLDRLREERGR